MTPRRSLVWWAVAAVTACGLAATAHGMYAVALACGVSKPVAVLYPVIADGLALAAYAATTRLRSWAQFYAWAVVVVAANLSGLAQGWHLASLSDQPGTTWALRFGMGYGVAVVCTVAAHLLWLVGRAPASTKKEVTDGAVRQGSEVPEAQGDPRHRLQGAGESGRRGDRSLGPAEGQADRPEDRQAEVVTTDAGGSGRPLEPGPGPSALTVSESNGHGMSLRAQAERKALDYLKQHGELPSEKDLTDMGPWKRGTARNALEPLRKG